MPKVSIIIPVYNTEKYLRKCLDSVCNQTLSDIEIICINDCSTDNSLGVLEEYSVNDKRLKIIDFKENKGVSVARNKGIDEAKGEYIGFIDSDDYIDLDFYEKLYNKAIETNADASKGNIFDVKNEEIELTDFYNINNKIRKNKINFLYGFTSAIYKTKVIKGNNIYFPEGITHFEDPYFSIKLSININKIEITDSAKYYYVKHDKSACANSKTFDKAKTFVESAISIVKLVNEYNLEKENYLIIINFLLEQMIPWCSDINLDKQTNLFVIDGLFKLLENSKYSSQEIFEFYFLNQKQISIIRNNNAIFEKLRKGIQQL